MTKIIIIVGAMNLCVSLNDILSLNIIQALGTF